MLQFDCLVDVAVVGFRSALNSSVSDFRKVAFCQGLLGFFWGVMGYWGGHAPDDIIALTKSSLML